MNRYSLRLTKKKRDVRETSPFGVGFKWMDFKAKLAKAGYLLEPNTKHWLPAILVLNIIQSYSVA